MKRRTRKSPSVTMALVTCDMEHKNTGDYRIEKVTLETNITRLQSFSTYKCNWYCYDADPFDPKFTDRMIELIKQLDIQPLVFPLPSAGIQLEWEKDDGNYLELEIHPESESFEFFQIKPEHRKYGMANAPAKELYTNTPYGAMHINNIVGNFYAREIGIAAKIWAFLSEEDFVSFADFIHRHGQTREQVTDIYAYLTKWVTKKEEEHST